MLDNVMLDNAMLDNAMLDNVMLDNVMLDNAMLDGNAASLNIEKSPDHQVVLNDVHKHQLIIMADILEKLMDKSKNDFLFEYFEMSE